ncbi:MAG: hypothetical protein COA78_29665 [Blastopirellula sp.]|nr:MAG: hypothetical protein COA78_29665 [Blastopirellula sp.]
MTYQPNKPSAPLIYRCTKCRQLTTIESLSHTERPPSVECSGCSLPLDEHDEVVASKKESRGF